CLSFHKSPLLKRSQRGTHLERTPLFFCLMSSSAYGGPGRIHVMTRHCVCVCVCVCVWVCGCVCGGGRLWGGGGRERKGERERETGFYSHIHTQSGIIAHL